MLGISALSSGLLSDSGCGLERLLMLLFSILLSTSVNNLKNRFMTWVAANRAQPIIAKTRHSLPFHPKDNFLASDILADVPSWLVCYITLSSVPT